ncbi:MAG TPA: GTP-binding protein, partial [Verrucomicrobiae bacterium]|nr:GTP-binding protein [Verrucomicrobiae bacterium]
HPVKCALLPLSGHDHEALHHAEHEAEELFGTRPRAISAGEELKPGQELRALACSVPGVAFTLNVPTPGDYALFFGECPEDLGMTLRRGGAAIEPAHVHEHGNHHHHHHHDEEVGSVGIEESRAIDSKKLNEWLGELLQSKGQDIFRMKGILNLKGADNRFVFQGVHMMFDGKLDRKWREGEARKSQIVFIGRNLDRSELTDGFRACVA